MTKYQKVIRGRDSLGKLPEMMEKTGIRKPMIVGSAHLTGILFRKVPGLLTAPVFSGYHANPDLADSEAGAELFRREILEKNSLA